jgi:hypothetical protein
MRDWRSKGKNGQERMRRGGFPISVESLTIVQGGIFFEENATWQHRFRSAPIGEPP